MNFSCFPLSLRLARPYSWAWGSHKQKSGALVTVSDEEKRPIGWGEIAPAPNDPFDSKTASQKVLSLVDGLDPFSDDFTERFEKRNPPLRYRNGIMSAVLTAHAFKKKMPLYQVLNSSASCEHIRVNGYLEAVSPDIAVERSAKFHVEGIRTIKVKCTEDYRADYTRVLAVSEAFPEFRFRLDPNQAWENIDTFAAFEKFAPLPIEYVEEPVAISTNFTLLSELRRIIPIAVDHWGSTVEELTQLADAEVADFVILKSQVFGGPDSTVMLSRHAHDLGLPSIMTVSLETLVGITIALHCAAAIPTCDLEHGLYFWDFFEPNVTEIPVVQNGSVTLPNAPGLGFSPRLEIKEGFAFPCNIEHSSTR